ncbi:kinase-like protein [Laetiporus sulphureus 93-53]|uniref:Kinase-like protein n=1 Tax=Laetiporus sulphureus 93-53 TaxID=1314785 RepID=A0A165GA40_9APHY|nr:kinase-like protein [Laetiporus sulphureus 93-53]KZT10053.1 kinase-like protein [Laetiporus sulphureus 93-53]
MTTTDDNTHPEASGSRDANADGKQLLQIEGAANEHGKSSSLAPSPASSSGKRGRSRTRATLGARQSDEDLRRRGYHTLMSSFGKAFHVEKRWKLIREMGSGAYGYVISAADQISGEPVAIKMVARATEKLQLAKRALREITLLRHFNHENITGLIDVDCTSDLSEIYIFMEPMEADLHQIIKSGQALSNEHVQYFVYQILRGMKYVHSASVVHRDLKPGNLLVNADCELKICDFGLSRGFNSKSDDNPTMMTEYVATRWYRAPEIMLAYKEYNTAIDVWSIGCILAELMLGKPLFKGKDYVDQLNKILDVLGTPDDEVIRRVASQKAAAYVRSLPIRKAVSFSKVLPVADLQATDLLTKILAFDPASRFSVVEALEHPWLASYHDVNDEPECPEPFKRWHTLEALETLEQYKETLWDEIQDYRREVRSVAATEGEHSASGRGSPTSEIRRGLEEIREMAENMPRPSDSVFLASPDMGAQVPERPLSFDERLAEQSQEETVPASAADESTLADLPAGRITDPVVRYSRRASTFIPSRTHSLFAGHTGTNIWQQRTHTPSSNEQPESSSVAFPTQDYVIPGRSRTSSEIGGEGRKLLRTLSTVSIYESGKGLAGGLADIAPIGKYIVEQDEALPSEMPRELESPPKVEQAQ